MSRLRLELALLLRPGMAALALAVLALLSAGAVVNGVRVIDQQRAQLARAVAAHDAEVAGLARRHGAGTDAGAAALLACLVLLTMILPAIGNTVIARLLPVAREVELALAQRQAVHQGWDLPKQQTMAQFIQSHPEWRDTEPVNRRFHWKWYFAMHQVGDEAVAGQLAAYRSSLAARERWSERTGWLLAAVDVQLLTHRLAQTDLQAQLAFYDRVAAFHARLRRAYYPGIFNEQPLGSDVAGMTRFDPHVTPPALPAGPLLSLALLAGLALARISQAE